MTIKEFNKELMRRDIIEKLNGMDKESAGRTSGVGFYYLLGNIVDKLTVLSIGLMCISVDSNHIIAFIQHIASLSEIIIGGHIFNREAQSVVG